MLRNRMFIGAGPRTYLASKVRPVHGCKKWIHGKRVVKYKNRGADSPSAYLFRHPTPALLLLHSALYHRASLAHFSFSSHRGGGTKGCFPCLTWRASSLPSLYPLVPPPLFLLPLVLEMLCLVLQMLCIHRHRPG